MARISVAALFLATVLMIPLASAALPAPVISFIPSNVSVNSSFLLVVDPGIDDPVRISWISYEAGAYGQVPKSGDKYICYFSDSDSKSTCGPSPFRYTEFNPYTLEINTTDSSGNMGGRNTRFNVGGIKLTSKITKDLAKRIVYMNVWPVPDIVSGITYRAYYAGNLSTVPGKYGSLTYDAPSGAYRENLTLGLGEYYIAFNAPAGSDYGGMVERVSMSLTGGTDNGEVTGYVDIDPVSLNILINKNQKYTKSNLRITNVVNTTITDLSVRIPETEPVDVNNYLSIELGNTSIGPFDFIYYTVVLEHVENYMEIMVQAELLSNDSVIGEIPIEIRVSVKNESGSTMVSCQDKSDGADCFGGICCGETCRKRANCCDDSDCASGEECQSYKCVGTGTTVQDIKCSTGTCRLGISSCPTGEEWKGACRTSGTDGICCATSTAADECLGEDDGVYCTDGICCSEECVIGDCCTDIDCATGDVCTYNYCTTPEVPPFDPTIPIIVAVAAIGGVGAFLYFKKFKKGGGGEEELGGEGSLEDEFY